MKKILIMIASVMTLTSMAHAQSTEFYFGADLFKGYNTFTYDWNTQPDYDLDNDSKGLRLKFGADLEDAWKVQGHFTIEDFDRNNFSRYGSDGDLYELGVDVIKGFPLDNSITPFLLAGVGMGWMDVDGYTENTIRSFALKIGIGLSFLFTPELEAVVGIDFKYRSWQEINGYVGMSYVELETRERIVSPYLGLNYHF